MTEKPGFELLTTITDTTPVYDIIKDKIQMQNILGSRPMITMQYFILRFIGNDWPWLLIIKRTLTLLLLTI